MAVKFCVVAVDETIARIIETTAKSAVELNPYGRKLLVRTDTEFPSQDDINRWAAENNISIPGSVTLRNDGSFFSVLSIDDAQNPAMIEFEFVNASESN